MIKVISVPLKEDLTEFTQFLWKHEIPHRVVEQGVLQELWVEPFVNAEDIYTLYEMWRKGGDLSQIKFSSEETDSNTSGGSSVIPSSNTPPQGFFVLAKQAWFSSILIISSIMLSTLIGFGDNFDILKHFTIAAVFLQDGKMYTSGLEGTLESMALWRIVTPIFLHFSAAHIIFNVLWIWVAGTRIECFQGRWVFIGLVLFSGITSNLAQYWVSGPMFGGLSGIVFALLGYAWLWDRVDSRKVGLPSALMGFMVIWLALGYSGVLSTIGFGDIANTAHLAGMIAGLLFVPVGKLLAKA